MYFLRKNSLYSKTLITIFFLLATSKNYCQTDSLAIKSYEDLIQLYTQTITKQPGKALAYMLQAHKIALSEKNKIEIARTYYGLGFCNFNLNRNSKALKNVGQAITILEKETYNKLLFQCYNLEGIIFTNKGEDSKALNVYLKAKEYAGENDDPINEINALTNIAFIKKVHKDYEEAIRIFKENLKILEDARLNDKEKLQHEISLYLNIADAYLRMGENSSESFTKEAKKYNAIGLQKCSQKTFPILYHDLLINDVVIAYEEENHQQSITLASKVVDFAIKNNYEDALSTGYFYIGKNYMKQKNYAQAIPFLEKVNAIFQKSEKKYSNEKQLNRLLSVAYTAEAEIEKGQEYFEKYVTLVEVESKNDLKVLKEVYVKNDIPELRNELEKIKNILIYEKNKKQRLYIIVGLLVLLLITSFVWYRKKVTKIKLRVEEVLTKVNELEKTQTTNKTSSISEKVTDQKAALLLEKLRKFEEREEFLAQDCSLSYVADKLSTNTSYISNVINKHKGKTFKAYITELRINASLIKLKNNKKLQSYTIKAIAEEFGFKRQETFSKAFKAQTGIYPSQYLKKLKETT